MFLLVLIFKIKITGTPGIKHWIFHHCTTLLYHQFSSYHNLYQYTIYQHSSNHNIIKLKEVKIIRIKWINVNHKIKFSKRFDQELEDDLFLHAVCSLKQQHMMLCGYQSSRYWTAFFVVVKNWPCFSISLFYNKKGLYEV